ncbi:hypothetical protein EVAR_76840_1 [Eumeta japonica]|uniref:Uncharacterized protein n=1 Tax=Eumeta variegata TaxID=151549 RepID=A0A4C1Z0X7_EUMVA|nr:hypothetical protein EVAR_76840_1 [Eumeta japonica]
MGPVCCRRPATVRGRYLERAPAAPFNEISSARRKSVTDFLHITALKGHVRAAKSGAILTAASARRLHINMLNLETNSQDNTYNTEDADTIPGAYRSAFSKYGADCKINRGDEKHRRENSHVATARP